MGDEEELADRVDDSRRSFVRRLVVGSAFAVPVVSSFDMTTLSMNLAAAQAHEPCQFSP